MAGSTANTFAPYIGYTFGTDTNVLGLANNDQYLPLTGQADGSDSTRTARGGINGSYRLSRQLLDVNAEFSQTKYEHFQALGYNGRNLGANWHWVLGNTLSGRIGASDVQTASQLSNFQQVTRNLRTDTQTHAEAAWMITPSWRLTLGETQYTLRYDLASQYFGNIDQNKKEGGLSYVTTSASTVGLLLQETDGKYPGRAGINIPREDFQQHEAKANIDWYVSGKSRLQLLFGWTSRTSADAVSRDFQGPTARATWDLASTGKTAITARAWREVAAVDDVLASYSINKGASLSPSWSVSEKVSLQGDLRVEKRSFQGSSVATYDTDRTVTLVLAYKPLRNILLQASGFTFSRQGNAYGGGYTRNGASISARYTF